MQKVTLLLLLLALASCAKKETATAPFDAFVYSYSAYPTGFSIKVTPGDTVYMQKRTNFERENYYALLKGTDRDRLIALTEQLDFSKYESNYEDTSVSDGVGIKFYKEAGEKSEWVYVYGDQGPEELYSLALEINEFAKRLRFAPTDKKIVFGNLEHIGLSPPPQP